MELLLASPKTTADDKVCPNGVQFYDVVEGKDASPRAAWSYEKPGASMRKVDHWLGFWEDVEVA